MDKRFQVFVSSTYEDLREERATVIKALLQLDCFPSGMELFPAADDDSLTLIKSMIDDCDYYLIILAGRYGSLERLSGKSYTHLEYEHALAMGKPTIALLHSDPGSLPTNDSEKTDDGRRRLEGFRAELREKNCRLWADLSELVAAVFTGVQYLRRTRPAVGWIRASNAPSEELKDEILRLRRELEARTQELNVVKGLLPSLETEGIAQGGELTNVDVLFTNGARHVTRTVQVSWEEIIATILPFTFGGGVTNDEISKLLRSITRAHDPSVNDFWDYAKVDSITVARVVRQLIALNLIESTQDSGITRWKAIPHRAQVVCRSLAERSDQSSRTTIPSPDIVSS